MPTNVIQAQIRLLRQERYSLLRGSVVEQLDAILSQGTCDTFLLLQRSLAIGRPLSELGMAGGRGAQMVAVVLGGHATTIFDEAFRLKVGDTLMLAGTHGEMEEAFRKLSPPAEGPSLLLEAAIGGRGLVPCRVLVSFAGFVQSRYTNLMRAQPPALRGRFS